MPHFNCRFATAIITTGVLFTSPIALAADMSIMEMLAAGLLQQKINCSRAHPELREKMESDYAFFAQSNSKFVSAEQWRNLETKLSATDQMLNRERCSELFYNHANFFEQVSIELADEPSQVRIQEIIAEKKKTRSVIGVGFSDKPDAYVQLVIPGSPAEKAGVKAGDLILGLQGEKIKRATQFVLAILLTEPGKIVNLSISRGLEVISLNVKVTTAAELE